MIGKKLFVPFSILVVLMIPNATAQKSAEHELHSDKARARLTDFDYTGQIKLCLGTHMIRHIDALDDWTLLVEMPGKKHYVNHLPRRCPELGIEERFSYTLRGLNQLCNTDIITVLHSDLRTGASCGLNKFEELKKKPKPEQ